MRLRDELESIFYGLGKVTSFHFLIDIGKPVLKPDRVICRVFERLGLIENREQLLEAVLQGRKFAEATGYPIRYIDIVFVAYGQVKSSEYGIDRGICLEENPPAIYAVQEISATIPLNAPHKSVTETIFICVYPW